VVVQDTSLNEAAKLAHVVLPAKAFAETDGSFTNFEGRVQPVGKAVKAPGEAMADGKIIGLLLKRLGADTGLSSAEDVSKAIRL
jgi:formate dehydrogenase major subunit